MEGSFSFEVVPNIIVGEVEDGAGAITPFDETIEGVPIGGEPIGCEPVGIGILLDIFLDKKAKGEIPSEGVSNPLASNPGRTI